MIGDLAYDIAGEFDSQFALPIGVITLTDLTNSTLVKTKTLPLPLTFPAVRQRDLIGEVGILATNRTRTIWFRLGFAPDHNFNRLDFPEASRQKRAKIPMFPRKSSVEMPNPSVQNRMLGHFF
jgi:hypothetical protein